MNFFKKTIYVIMILMFPFNVFAYSDYVIPGGENLGIQINSKGVMVIGFYKINGNYNKGEKVLQEGDIITKVNDKEINTITELINIINEEIKDGKVKLSYKRNGDTDVMDFKLEYIDGVYKTGLYVKDSITGIGTLTYIDPESLIYGALGHEVIESNTKNKIEVKTGSIFQSSITGIDKSADGSPGGKNASFNTENEYGTIEKNTNVGIYGNYEKDLPVKDLLKVGTDKDIELGKAYIQTVVQDEEVEKFEITITNIDKSSEIKNINFKITDPALLDKTGGVVQGMSGSPIIQNDMIVGAVTHVIVDNVQNGYGVFITTMLEEGES